MVRDRREAETVLGGLSPELRFVEVAVAVPMRQPGRRQIGIDDGRPDIFPTAQMDAIIGPFTARSA